MSKSFATKYLSYLAINLFALSCKIWEKNLNLIFPIAWVLKNEIEPVLSSSIWRIESNENEKII